MRVQIRLLVLVVEAGLGLPASLTLQLLLVGDLILIDEREGQRQVLFRVRVEVGLVIDNLIAELLLLELVDVPLLSTIAVHFHAFGDFESGSGRATGTQLAQPEYICMGKVAWILSVPL